MYVRFFLKTIFGFQGTLLGVLRGPISGQNRGMFSKLNGPSPLGSGGHSYSSFSIGRFYAQWNSFGGDVPWDSVNLVEQTTELCYHALLQSVFQLNLHCLLHNRDRKFRPATVKYPANFNLKMGPWHRITFPPYSIHLGKKILFQVIQKSKVLNLRYK